MRFELSRRDSRRLAAAIGWARVGLGATALLMPKTLLRPWVGYRQADPGAVLLGRALGARDLGLGMGAVVACRGEAPVRWWIAAGGLADAADAVATLLAFPRLPAVSRWLVVAAATGGAAAAALAVGGVDAD